MSALKSILVHVDSTPQAAERLKVAQQIAARHGAQATALYAVTSALARYPVAFAAGAGAAAVMTEFDEQRLERAKAMFAKSTALAQPAVAWLRSDGAPVSALAREALYADLLVLGQAGSGEDADADVPADFVSSVLIDSGRPALVLPYIGARPTLARNVLVAWKETREAARAVTAALPLLQQAEKVRVACFDETQAEPATDTVGIAAFLRRHGVSATVQHQRAPSHDLGEYLLSLAADAQADLLVMGCYGHGRAREWVLGGVTRTMLQSMTLPVLMVH
jgi:nucleotide-binding universal stress UspA family protein